MCSFVSEYNNDITCFVSIWAPIWHAYSAETSVIFYNADTSITNYLNTLRKRVPFLWHAYWRLEQDNRSRIHIWVCPVKGIRMYYYMYGSWVVPLRFFLRVFVSKMRKPESRKVEFWRLFALAPFCVGAFSLWKPANTPMFRLFDVSSFGTQAHSNYTWAGCLLIVYDLRQFGPHES